MTNIKLSICMVVVLMCLSVPAAQAISFYTGDIRVQSLDISIDVQDVASVQAEYVLVNDTSDTRQVSLDFSPSYAAVLVDGERLVNPMVFQPGESKSISLAYDLVVEGTDTKSLTFKPVIRFNGMRHSKVTDSYNIKAKLPENVNGLILSSKEFTSKRIEGNRVVYSWEIEDVYPTPLYMKWSTLDVQLEIQKDVTGVTHFNQSINVTIRIKNNGSAELRNVVLYDVFMYDVFAPGDSPEDFIHIPGSIGNSPVFIWNETIKILGPGETREFSYSIRTTSVIDVLLKATKAMVGDSVVAFSNSLMVEIELCGNGVCDLNENNVNCPSDCPFNDYDKDGIDNDLDNCPGISNADQTDTDSDGRGDICDPYPDDESNDKDGDGYGIGSDNCPDVSNPDQVDTDSDGFGDTCDNCPNAYNPRQEDCNDDGTGDACDAINPDADDSDCDGIDDNCNGIADEQYVPTPTVCDLGACGVTGYLICIDGAEIDTCSYDTDGDGIGDFCDNCPSVHNPDQTDADNDGEGDACDCDADGLCTAMAGCIEQGTPDPDCDITPPTTDDYAFDDVWTNVDALITLTVTDPEPSSGIAGTRYCIDATGTSIPAIDYTGPISITTEGVSYLRYHSQDNADNLEEKSKLL